MRRYANADKAAARWPAQLVLCRIAVPTTPAQTVLWSIPIINFLPIDGLLQLSRSVSSWCMRTLPPLDGSNVNDIGRTEFQVSYQGMMIITSAVKRIVVYVDLLRWGGVGIEFDILIAYVI